MEEPRMIPYGNTGSGHAAGSDTSRERQERNDADGTTSLTQSRVLAALDLAGPDGVTAADIEDWFTVGHGAASSALSHLHRAGQVTRVKMRRKRHEIYVLPQFVNGREESPYRPRLAREHPRQLSRDVVMEAMGEARIDESHYGAIRAFLSALP